MPIKDTDSTIYRQGDPATYEATVSYQRDTWPDDVNIEAGKSYRGTVESVHPDPYAAPGDDTSYVVVRLENGADIAHRVRADQIVA